jgi:hypothetical protein
MTQAQAILDQGFAAHLAVHGEPATFTPSGGQPATIDVIFDEPSDIVNEYGSIITTKPKARTWSASAPIPTATHGTLYLIDRGETFHIQRAEPDGLGVTMMSLTPETQAPLPPNGLCVQLNLGAAELVWTRRATNNSAVEVWSDPDGDGLFELLATLAAGVTTYSDPTPARAYKVRNTNKSGNSPFTYTFNMTQMVLVDEFGSPILDESGHPILATP